MISQYKPTERFSMKVDNYVKYRPHYPPQVVELLAAACGLTPEWVIADIGSGTGFSAELFLQNGNRVFGIEPNAPMRAAGEAYLAAYPNFTNVAATAEETTLPDASIDMALAGQAFHWFDQERARPELLRIMKPGAWLTLMWNSRDDASPFQRDYEQFVLQFGTDYSEIRHQNVSRDALERFYGPAGLSAAEIPQAQIVDFAGLAGRVLSSSYMPGPDHERYEAMLAELRRLFDRHAVDGRLSLDLKTQVFWGRLS